MSKEALSVGATVATLAFFAANFQSTRKFAQKGTVGDATPLPFVATVVNCFLWTRYGILLKDNTIIIVNFVGVLVAAYSLFLYYQYAENRRKVENLSLGAGMFLLGTMLYTQFGDPTLVVGHLGFLACTGKDFHVPVLTICMFGSPLAALGHVVRTRNSSVMSLPLSVASLLVCALWTGYGYTLSDSAIIVPNFVGGCLALIQLFVYWKYRVPSPNPNEMLLRPAKFTM
ncbi:sugar efflux transporter for intercellular exchange-domain-containing protein [Paraphysoderma sedebokerense]|nr:sugar efflux transporter for intercellular exchange-domain-containing protein [Paraphysoderma sedebokerense]